MKLAKIDKQSVKISLSLSFRDGSLASQGPSPDRSFLLQRGALAWHSMAVMFGANGAARTTITWTSDYSVVRDGWNLTFQGAMDTLKQKIDHGKPGMREDVLRSCAN